MPHLKTRAASILLLGALSLSGLGLHRAIPTAYAGQRPPTTPFAALRLTADKPIIHLGETATLRGTGFTPGATVAFSLHGPFSAGVGRTSATAVVATNGTIVQRVTLATYPDATARQFHKVIIAAASSARTAGLQEGAAVALQVDPMPALAITTRAALTGLSWTIDGQEVPAAVTKHDATHYTATYGGHLRAGAHSSYLKWHDASGHYGTSLWTFSIGDPTAVPAVPRLTLNATRIHLGATVLLAGTGFTPGASILISVGGINARPHPAYTTAAGPTGAFSVRLRIAAYPDANARLGGAMIVGAQATGPAVGDLPEGVADLLLVGR